MALWAICGAANGQTITAGSYDRGEYDAQSEIRQLRERLDAYDSDLRDMRSAMRQTIQRLPDTTDSFIEANWNSSLFEAKDGEPVEIPIIEKPITPDQVRGVVFQRQAVPAAPPRSRQAGDAQPGLFLR